MQKLCITEYLRISLAIISSCISGMDVDNHTIKKYPITIRHQQKIINSYVQNKYEEAEAIKQEAQILKHLNEKANAETAIIPKNKNSSCCTFI